MANLLIVSFTKKTTAVKALHKIKELDFYGDITLCEHIMIHKNENYLYEVLDDDTDVVGWKTFTGMELKGIVGLLAGPIGLVIELYSGTAAGSILNIGRYNLEYDFIHQINNKMKLGTIALIAEVSEDSSMLVDKYLKTLDLEFISSKAGVETNNSIDKQIHEMGKDIKREKRNRQSMMRRNKTILPSYG